MVNKYAFTLRSFGVRDLKLFFLGKKKEVLNGSQVNQELSGDLTTSSLSDRNESGEVVRIQCCLGNAAMVT